MQTRTPWHGRAVSVAFALLATLPLAACRRDMQDQPRYKPLAASDFFTDGRSARPFPSGTIARGELDNVDEAHTGADHGKFLAQIPVPVTLGLLQRGRERYNIYCTPCHGMLGDGKGMVAYRGLKWPANLLSDRARKAPPGYIFQVISYGYGAMGDYGDQIPVADRWAIVAYLHALQLSRAANIADVPAGQRRLLGAQP